MAIHRSRRVMTALMLPPTPGPILECDGRWARFLGIFVADSQTTSSTLSPSPPYMRWLAQALGLVLFHFVALGAGRENGLWLPGLGFGIALVSWFGWWYVPLLAVDLFLVRLGTHSNHPL